LPEWLRWTYGNDERRRQSQLRISHWKARTVDERRNVRFGSTADMRNAKLHVRSGPKADMLIFDRVCAKIKMKRLLGNGSQSDPEDLPYG